MERRGQVARQAGDTAAERASDDLEIGWRARLAIVGFWTLFALVTIANLSFSPVGEPRPPRPGLVAFTFLGAYTWAALTPPLLRFASRFDLEYGDRVRRVLGLTVLAIAIALAVSTALALIGDALIGLPPGRRPLTDFERLAAAVRFRFLNDLMSCLLVLSAGMAYDYFRRYRARQEEAALLRAQLVESRLETLRTQLNPHFLFNTLNAVSGLVARDPKGVRRMIARLSEVLRYSLDGAREQEIPLEEELRILRLYLEILEIRYQGRLQTAIHAEPDTLDARVPTLVLQPLAENAVKHGVGQAGGHGRIDVRARREGDELVLAVHDTGAGQAVPTGGAGEAGSQAESRPPLRTRHVRAAAVDAHGAENATPTASRGLGLRHTRERLEQLYGAAYRLELHPAPDGGTIAEVHLPWHVTPLAAGEATHG